MSPTCNSILSAFALCAALLAGACGTDTAPYFPGGFTDIGTADGGADGSIDVVGAACEEHADCAGGQVCRDGFCEEIGGTVCEPGAGTCDDNTAVVCNEAGSAQSRVDCGDDLCVVGSTGASCLPATCEDGSVGCVDGRTAYTCAEGERELQTCAADEGCLAGECEARICAPGSRRCDGDTVIVCGSAGVSESAVQCARTPECQESEAGCACVEGTCVTRACVPSERTCVDDEVVECSATGEGTRVVETCGEGSVCRSGECVDDTCEAGTSSCAGDVRLTCDAATGALRETDCRDSESYCREFDGTTAGCVGWECEPGAVTCDRTGFVRITCDARGTSFEQTRCPEGNFCSDGACLPQVCTPRTRRCTSGDVYACSANGSGFVLSEACPEGTSCEGGLCVGGEPECTSASDCPAPRGRCEGTTLVTYTANGVCSRGACDFAPVTRRTDCAASSQVCSSTTLACVRPDGPSCTTAGDCPDGFCVDGACADCRSAGDCLAGQLCVDGECDACSCEPGFICDTAGRCIEGDPGECSSDAECRDLAVRLGASPDGAACDSEVGCYTRGFCGTDLLPTGGTDPFSADCAAGLTCGIVLDLVGGTISNACKGCTAGDDTTCRDGETCYTPLFGFPDNSPYCTAPSSGGGGLPFP